MKGSISKRSQQPRGSKLVNIVIPREHLWDTLRKTGEDSGSYTIGPTGLEELHISINPPPKVTAADITLLPVNPASEEEQNRAASTRTWAVNPDQTKSGVTCAYKVLWKNRPSLLERKYKSYQVSHGKN